MKTTSLLTAATTVSAICLFGVNIQTAKADSAQKDHKHHSSGNSHSGSSLHSSSGGHSNKGHYGNSQGQSRGYSSSHSATYRPQETHHNHQGYRVSSPSHVTVHTGNQSAHRSSGHYTASPSHVTVQHGTVKSHGYNSHRVSAPVHVNTHTSRVVTTNRTHTSHFRVSKTHYDTFRSGGWRHHHGWNRDRHGYFYYNRHRIYFSFTNGYYIPYYYGVGNTIVYLPETTYYDAGGQVTVSDVQQALANDGYYNGAVDGILGPHTSAAISNFQRDHNLAVTGEINSALIDALGLD